MNKISYFSYTSNKTSINNMQNLAQFLTRIQTFELRIITVKELKSHVNEDENKKAYSIAHETHYYDSFTYKSELRVLKDLALIDILALDDTKIKREIGQLKKLKDRFKVFWTNFQNHHNTYEGVYPKHYVFAVQLQYLFIVKNLQSDYTDIFIGEQFVEDLSDSVKLRENFLAELIYDLTEILNPKETFEEWKAKQEKRVTESVEEIENDEKQSIQEFNTEAGLPIFYEQIIAQFLQLMKPYFSDTDYKQLSALIKIHATPEARLVFRGNGNQLSDAFKQLYEANLIIGCKKSDLEKWIAKHFLYAAKDTPKEYTEGWLSAVISTDTKFCKSPILQISMKNGVPVIAPTKRNKKNSKNW
jgi:hypothetical protein